MRLWLSLIVIMSCFSAHCQWYESQGQALIKNGDKQSARTQAMQNALKKALLVAGASVSSVQQVVNGLLTQDEISIRASGSVNSVTLIDETYEDQLVTVTIRADIFGQERQCFSADYRKGLLLTRSNLLHREQANIGELYELDTVLVKNLATKLQQHSQFIDARLAIKSKTKFSRYNQSFVNEDIKQLTMSLANLTDSQYVLYSEISDLSFTNNANNNWQFWQEDVFDRHLAFALYIYNGNNGELVFEHQYQNSAPWDFSKRAIVDMNSQTFWQSHYAQMLNNLLDNAVSDIDESIMCEPTRGKIIQVNGSEISISLGAHQGVKIGDEFSLLHLSNVIGNNGQTYAGYTVSPYAVKVTQVSQQSAKAMTVDGKLLGNIQVEDLAVRY